MKRVFLFGCLLAVCSLTLAEEQPPPSPPPPTVTWKPAGGLRITLKNFELAIGARLQVRLANEDQDFCAECVNALALIRSDFGPSEGEPKELLKGSSQHFGDPVTGSDTSSTDLSVRRFKLVLGGWAFDPRFKYDFQLETTAGRGDNDAGIREANVDLQFIPQAQLKIGQWKGPFGRQRITSDGNQEFVDLALATDTFAMGFEDGIMLHGGVGGEKHDRLEYNVGVFDGKGLNPPITGQTAASDNRLLYAARVVWMPLGSYGYFESAVDNPDHFLFYVGGSYNTNGDRSSAKTSGTAGSKTRTTTDRWGGEAGLRYKRFSAAGEYFHSSQETRTRDFDPVATQDSHAVQTGGSRFTLRSSGYYVQAGIFLVSKTLELAARLSEVDNGNYEHDASREIRGGVNWFISRTHAHKLQFDVGELRREFNQLTVSSGPLGVPGARDNDETVKEQQVRLQYQFWF